MRILVSGAGVAGLSAAATLAATGHDVTIVERAARLRVGGSPIDVRGDSLKITARMGILDQIHANRVDMTERVQFVDQDGMVVAELPSEEIGDSAEDVEIPREDLLRILQGALPPSAKLLFGDHIAELHDDGEGVDVRVASGARGRYDLVVGADGMHSAVRRLAFGPESQFLRHLGFYIALARMPEQARPDRINPMFNFPGHLTGFATYHDTSLATFAFRSPWIDYDYRDLEEQKRILREAFDGHDEWRIPELLAAAQNDPELYFDSISQIHMPTWHKSRVVLVGDSGYCASPLSGRGTSLAITGAWFLAQALREHPDDLSRAFEQYERDQQPHVVRAQATTGPGGDFLIPATQEAIEARNRRFSVTERAGSV